LHGYGEPSCLAGGKKGASVPGRASRLGSGHFEGKGKTTSEKREIEKIREEEKLKVE